MTDDLIYRLRLWAGDCRSDSCYCSRSDCWRAANLIDSYVKATGGLAPDLVALLLTAGRDNTWPQQLAALPEAERSALTLATFALTDAGVERP